MEDELLVLKYIKSYEKHGFDAFYKILLNISGENCKYSDNPEVDLLIISDRFFELSKLNNSDKYYDIGRCFRKAAHSIYRSGLKKGKQKDERFLNIIK